MIFDSSTGCEPEMFGHLQVLQHNNRVGDALVMTINVKIFRSRRKYFLKTLHYYIQNKIYAKYPVPCHYNSQVILIHPKGASVGYLDTHNNNNRVGDELLFILNRVVIFRIKYMQNISSPAIIIYNLTKEIILINFQCT